MEMDNAITFLKERWWAILFVAVIAVLLLIPTKTGLPDKDYQGCSVKGSYCLTTKTKTVSQEKDGLTSITVPITFSDGVDDVTFKLAKDRGLKVGDEVFINLAEETKKAYLFINSDSNLLFTILSKLFDSSQGVTAIIDLNTMTEVKSQSP